MEQMLFLLSPQTEIKLSLMCAVSTVESTQDVSLLQQYIKQSTSN